VAMSATVPQQIDLHTTPHCYLRLLSMTLMILENILFLPRIINTWNSLPDFVVNVEYINIFKNRLDTFWSDQEIIYDYTAEITGIGDRSEFIS